jgi:hypothetical protein
MDRSGFADLLRDVVIGAWKEFRRQHPAELPYALALVVGRGGKYLGYAVATEERLKRLASRYHRMGYKYQAWDWERVNNRAKLADWLRWANPDDGWHCGDFPKRFAVQDVLHQLVESGTFGEDADQLEEFCIEVLSSLRADQRWVRLMGKCPIVVGVTYGEDPRDFLRTATVCNKYHVVRQLWSESWRGEELDHRISRPNGSRTPAQS